MADKLEHNIQPPIQIDLQWFCIASRSRKKFLSNSQCGIDMIFSVPAMTQWLRGRFGSSGASFSSSCRVAGASLGLFPSGDVSLKCLGSPSLIKFASGDVGYWWPFSQMSLGSLSVTFLRAKGSATLAHKVARSFITELDS